MKSTHENKEKSLEIICPICGEIMKKDLYAYDSMENGKINYKCDNCGHRSSKII